MYVTFKTLDPLPNASYTVTGGEQTVQVAEIIYSDSSAIQFSVSAAEGSDTSFITFDQVTGIIRYHTLDNELVDIYTITVSGSLYTHTLSQTFDLEVLFHYCIGVVDPVTITT